MEGVNGSSALSSESVFGPLHGGWCGYSEQLRPLAAFLSLFPQHSSRLTIAHKNITGNTFAMPTLGKLEMTEERQRQKEKGK